MVVAVINLRFSITTRLLLLVTGCLLDGLLLFMDWKGMIAHCWQSHASVWYMNAYLLNGLYSRIDVMVEIYDYLECLFQVSIVHIGTTLFIRYMV